MVSVIKYELEPSLYVANMVAKGGSLGGFLEAWRSGQVNMEPDYVVDVVIAWVTVLPPN